NLTESFPHPYTEADADKWLSFTRTPGRDLHLAIEFAGAVVGGIGAIAGDGIARQTCQFGYWLGRVTGARVSPLPRQAPSLSTSKTAHCLPGSRRRSFSGTRHPCAFWRRWVSCGKVCCARASPKTANSLTA